MRLIRTIIILFLVTVLLSAAAIPVGAAKLTDAEYSALFQRACGAPEDGLLEEVEAAFLSDPMGFVTALAEEDYNTIHLVHFLTLSNADWVNDPDRHDHRNALLQVANTEALTQPQRRVVSFMLRYTKVMNDYVIYTDQIDYGELFSRTLEADASASYSLTHEILLVFDRDPKEFIQALALEDEPIRQDVIEELAAAHYLGGGQSNIGDALNAVKGSGTLHQAQLQLIEDFWAQVTILQTPPPPPPTTLTTVPTTVSATQSTTTLSMTASTQPTTTLSTQPQAGAQEAPRQNNDYTVWVILGVIAVIFGVQAVTILRNRKTQTQDDTEE